MADAMKRPEPVQRKEIPGAPRQVKDSRRKDAPATTAKVVFDDWALI